MFASRWGQSHEGTVPVGVKNFGYNYLMAANDRFPQYTTDYISGVMSLRKPQTESLKILEEILENITLRKGGNIRPALAAVNFLYPTCTDFEREFISLTFALATGVGKTRLMGAFIALLYTRHNFRNFFVVAPNTTIFEKLKRELSNPNDPKYVFRGLGCFVSAPEIVTDEDYKSKQLSFLTGDIRIFVYNIDKFNKETASMRRENEMLGNSFIRMLSELDDLALIMDESHHYRAEKGAAALNDLKPLLGLELTATPLVTKGNKQIPFKNVVYEYPLSHAIRDGFTRTPFAVTRSDIRAFDFGDEQLDKLMLGDGITCHENVKRQLAAYAANNQKSEVKPFMLVVCKDTEHAEWVKNYVCSDAFRDGKYKNKTLVIHSHQKSAESEANTRALLGVENPDNPIEIVIHVNMLKEGWDVNNLYTIVPLRTAASKILREQMVGRGLRLPYGVRTGERDVDAVFLTAHDRFDEILAAAQRGDSIFRAENVIQAEDLAPVHIIVAQPALDLEKPLIQEKAEEEFGLPPSETSVKFYRSADEMIRYEVSHAIQHSSEHTVTPDKAKEIAQKTVETLAQDKDPADMLQMTGTPIIAALLEQKAEQICKASFEKFIPIPQIKITDNGTEEFVFLDFDIDLEKFDQQPVPDRTLILQNLENPADRQHMRGDYIDFEGFNPQKRILEGLRKAPEIDYERCAELMFKLINQVCDHYRSQYGLNGLKNIVMMYQRQIVKSIYEQMLQHVYQHQEGFFETVEMVRKMNLEPAYSYKEKCDLYMNSIGNIQSVLFTGIHKGVFDCAKFDSKEGELTLARLLEQDEAVLKWLRPHPKEFNIYYNHGHRYEPDFVVETLQKNYLVEVKGEDKLKDPEVIAKKERGVQYCETASRWAKANGFKEWQYLFIPAGQIYSNTTFRMLAERYSQ